MPGGVEDREGVRDNFCWMLVLTRRPSEGRIREPIDERSRFAPWRRVGSFVGGVSSRSKPACC
jgi:hypothetical protein